MQKFLKPSKKSRAQWDVAIVGSPQLGEQSIFIFGQIARQCQGIQRMIRIESHPKQILGQPLFWQGEQVMGLAKA